MESYPAIVPRGGGLPRLERLAYFPRMSSPSWAQRP